MFAGLRRLLLTGGFLLLASCAAWAQTTTLQGDVKDENGQPLKGAVIVLTRTDIKGHYQVKSDKKGHWLYTGLPFGKYDIECQVDGKTVDKVNGVQSSYSDDGKPISAALFVPVIEQLGLAVELDKLVLDMAVRDMVAQPWLKGVPQAHIVADPWMLELDGLRPG